VEFLGTILGVIRALPANLFGRVVEWIDAGRGFALVSVVHASGSTPRKTGTRAVVDEGGQTYGTIGGGPLENRAQQLASEAIRTGRPAVLEQKFTSPSAAENLPICGGVMRVLVDPTASASRGAYAAAAEACRNRRRGVLLTRVEAGSPMRVTVEFRESGADVVSENEGGELLIEPVVASPRLLVVGGGHVGQALAQQAALVGFEVVLFEDRAEFADPGLLPAGTMVRLGDVGETLGAFDTDEDTFIALVSRGHVTDCRALAAVIRKPAAYLGMMGSLRKIALVRKHFIETGLADEAELARLHAPIGLEIGAQSVPEIAASIVAELIAVRRGKGSDEIVIGGRSA
jgi:xanthine dehydrogenase accessory factor